MAGHIGFQRHWQLCTEDTWGGGPPVSPTYYSAPAVGSGYRIKQTTPPFIPPTNAGGYQRKHHVLQKYQVEGNINTYLYRDSCEYLLNLCTKRTSNVLDSFCGQVNDPVECKQHVGLMVNQWTLGGAAEGAEITLSMDCIGKGPETAVAAFSDPSYLDEAPFIFQHGAFYLSSGAGEASDLLGKILSFELRGNNNLQQGPIGSSYAITDLVAGLEVIEGHAAIEYEASTWNAAVRAGSAIAFKVVFTHPLGGTDGVVTIRCDDCWCAEAPEEGDPGALVTQTINFSAELPDTGDQLSIVVIDGA